MGARQSKRADHSTGTGGPMGPVDKLKWLAAAAGLPLPGRVELAVLVVITDMMSSASGQAWPSFATLASRTGSSPRNVKRAVKRLCDCGLLVIVEHGNRVRSNRYTLNAAKFATVAGGDVQDTTVVTPASSCSDLQVPDVVTHRPPESIHESEPKAKDEVDRSQADGGAAPSRPLRASGAPRAGEAFAEFWEAMGRRTSVAEAEQLIREAMSEGHEYQAIVDGARRYRNYCADTGGIMKLNAAAWLQKEKWRDDWQLVKPEPKPKPSAKQSGQGKPASKAKPAKSPQPSADYADKLKAWKREKKDCDKQGAKLEEDWQSWEARVSQYQGRNLPTPPNLKEVERQLETRTDRQIEWEDALAKRKSELIDNKMAK